VNDLTPERRYPDDEIDLFELISDLWAEKWIIAACTFVVAAGALAYAFLSTPVYEATARVLPPTESDIVGYNVGRLTLATMDESRLDPLKPDDIYSVFTRTLQSQRLRNRFFEEYYLPYLGINAEQEALQVEARETIRRRFASVLSVNQPSARERPEDFQVRVTLQDPELASRWANNFVEMAARQAEQQMINDISNDLRSRAAIAERRLATLESMAEQDRQDRVARLQEAIQIARALGLENSQISAGRTSSDSELAALVEGDLMYLRGTRALEAELEVLQARTNDAPFIADYRMLQTRAQVLDSLTIDESNVAVFTFDSPAEVPDTPIKPRKALILALGILLGGMLGGMTALVRIVIRKRKQAQKPA